MRGIMIQYPIRTASKRKTLKDCRQILSLESDTPQSCNLLIGFSGKALPFSTEISFTMTSKVFPDEA